MFQKHQCPQCKKEQDLLSFQDGTGLCSFCGIDNKFAMSRNPKPSAMEIFESKQRIQELSDIEKKQESDRKQKLLDLKVEIAKHVPPRSNPVQPKIATSNDALNDLKHRGRNYFCQTPGCFTKLRNKSANICSYCKAKHGWYKW